MAIYDYMGLPKGVSSYLRMTAMAFGLGGAYLIHQAQNAGQNIQPWGMDPDSVKLTLFGIGASALVSTLMKGREAVDKIGERNATLSIEDRLNQDNDDGPIDRAA